jgi:hypothetical protein
VPREFEESSTSIVLLGSFNPSIFSPAWFGRYGLLSDQEVASAAVGLIHPDITIFEVDWLSIRVEPQRFQALTRVSPIQIRDIVLKTFKDYLMHTPIHSMGVNRQAHFKFRNLEQRMHLGRAMAPLAPWGPWGQDIDKGEVPGGLASLTMQQPRPSGPKGFLQITVQPSNSVPRKLGVFFQVNDHYEVASRDNLTGSEEIMEILDSQFQRSLARAEEILDQVLTEAEK